VEDEETEVERLAIVRCPFFSSGKYGGLAVGFSLLRVVWLGARGVACNCKGQEHAGGNGKTDATFNPDLPISELSYRFRQHVALLTL
jgi:hypothetical protein